MTSHPGLATFSSAGGSLGFENSEPSTGSKVQIHCQVAGCDNLLPAGKVYYARHKICWEHSRLRSLDLGNEKAVRWCQQCGMFQYLSEFDGDKRSCRVSLRRHNGRRRTLRAVQRRPPQPPAHVEPSVLMQGHVAPHQPLPSRTSALHTEPFSNPSLQTLAALMMQLPGGDVSATCLVEDARTPHEAAAGLLAAGGQEMPALTASQHLFHGVVAGTQGPVVAPVHQRNTSGPSKEFTMLTMPDFTPPLAAAPGNVVLTQSTLSQAAPYAGQQQQQHLPHSEEEMLQLLTRITSLERMTNNWHHDGGRLSMQPACFVQQS